jgi:hypothetical protein
MASGHGRDPTPFLTVYERWLYAALSALANGLLRFTLVALETIVLH